MGEQPELCSDGLLNPHCHIPAAVATLCMSHSVASCSSATFHSDSAFTASVSAPSDNCVQPQLHHSLLQGQPALGHSMWDSHILYTSSWKPQGAPHTHAGATRGFVVLGFVLWRCALKILQAPQPFRKASLLHAANSVYSAELLRVYAGIAVGWPQAEHAAEHAQG